jgi:hypothetical protein
MAGRRRGRGRHGGGRGRQPVGMWVWLPRDRLPGDETSQTRPTCEHDPYRNQPSRGGAGGGFRARGRTDPPPSRNGAQHVR